MRQKRLHRSTRRSSSRVPWETVADRLRLIYAAVVIEELRAAVDALNSGDVEPFVGLLDENSEWRGITSGHLWWKHAPS